MKNLFIIGKAIKSFQNENRANVTVSVLRVVARIAVTKVLYPSVVVGVLGSPNPTIKMLGADFFKSQTKLFRYLFKLCSPIIINRT